MLAVVVSHLSRKERVKDGHQSFVDVDRRRDALDGAGASQFHDLVDHVCVRVAGFLCRHGEFGGAGEPWVRVGFDDVCFAFFVQAHIDAAVVTQLECAIGSERGVQRFFVVSSSRSSAGADFVTL